MMVMMMMMMFIVYSMTTTIAYSMMTKLKPFACCHNHDFDSPTRHPKLRSSGAALEGAKAT